MSAIIELIWKFLGPTIVNLAISVGLPAAMEWLMKKGLPKWLVDGLINIVKSAIEEITKVKNDPNLSPQEVKLQVREIKRGARMAAKRECSGAGCPSGLVGE